MEWMLSDNLHISQNIFSFGAPMTKNVIHFHTPIKQDVEKVKYFSNENQWICGLSSWNVGKKKWTKQKALRFIVTNRALHVFWSSLDVNGILTKRQEKVTWLARWYDNVVQYNVSGLC